MDDLLRATARAETNHFWFRGFRRFVAPLIGQALGGRTDARILDCGCGTGTNLEFLRRFGTPYGFDFSEVGLLIGRDSGKQRLARGSVAAAPFSSETFDLVTSFDVLYALNDHDERAAVAEMYRLVRPGGHALVNVAALDLLRGDHSVLSREVRRYNRARLRALVTDAGFTIVRLTYTNIALCLPLAIMRAAQRRRGLAKEAEATQEISVPPAPLNALLSGVLFLESVWLRRFDSPIGSSLLCLARKRA